MKSSAIRLPRRRFLKLKGNMVELAVGLLVAVMIETQAAAHAETLPADTGADTGTPAPALPEGIAAVDPEAIRTLSIDELKQLLDAKMLAALGLDAGFLQLLDIDAGAAIRRLETAFRDKVKVAAKSEAKVAAAGDAHGDAAGDVAHADRASADTHHESALDGGFSPLWLLAGLAVVGGGVALAGGGGGKDGPAPNNAPTATNDSFTTAEDTAVTFDVRTNDSDRDGDALAVTQINGTAITTASPVTITGGVVSLNADGKLTFTPAANYNGTPGFTYTLSDGKGGTTTATVSGTVTAVNDVPVATADSFTTAEDTAVTFDVRTNDSDVDGDTLSVTQINGTAITTTSPVAVTGGVVTLNADGKLTFTPTANYNGAPNFTYTLSDGKGGTATATVGGTVTAVNDAPVNTLPASVGPVAQGSAVAINGLSIGDVDGGTGSFTTTLSVAHGTLVAGTVTGGAAIAGSGTATVVLTGTVAQVNATLATLGYTSAGNYAGQETLTIVTSDGQASDTDTLNLTVAQVTTGVVIDGYVAGARIFFDANDNGQYDQGEVVATTDDQGRFTLVGEPVGTMIALGGVNTDTGLPNTIPLKAPAGSSTVTPLTTLVAELTNTGTDLATAQAQVARAFGLPEGINLSTFDFLSPTADPAVGFAVQKAATQIATLMIQGQTAGVSATAIGEQIAQLTKTGTVDLGNPAQLASVLQAAGGDATVAAAAQKAASINQAVASATSPDKLVDTVRDLNAPNANLPPVAQADSVKFGLGISAGISVLTNDSDPEGGALGIVAINGRPIDFSNSVELEHGTLSLSDHGTLTFTPAAGFLGSQSFTYTVADTSGATATATVTASLAGPVLPVAFDALQYALSDPAALAAAGVTTIDIDPGYAEINEIQANKLVDAGIDFAEADSVGLVVEGTHLSTTLKALQALHVDAVMVGPGVTTLSLDAGGSLDSLGVANLPRLDAAHSDETLDVTLNVDTGTLAAGADLTALARGLRDSGVDHLGVTGNGALALDLGQAQALAGAELDFASAADITVDVRQDQLDGIASDPALLAQLHVDHIDVDGPATITEAQAAALIGAGVDFVESDDVTLSVEGTHMATTLKGLQALHIDAVAVGMGVTMLSLDAGGALDSLSSGDLPSFTIDQTDAALDVTLTVDAGMLGQGFDMFQLAPALAGAGIDHIGVAGSGALGLSLQQAWGVSVSGMDFTPAADVTVHLAATELAAVTAPGEAALLGQINVDTLDIVEDRATITDDQAANLVAAGLHFADGDDITVAAEGTHLSTTLRGLHDLKVDAVAVAVGAKLVVDAGDLTGLSAADLPQFDTAQPDDALDVTLRVDAGQLGALVQLAQGLAAAGIDHIVTNQDLTTLDPAEADALADVTRLFGIDISYEPFEAAQPRFLDPDEARVEAGLIQEMRNGFEGADDDGTGGVYRITDGAHHALAESGLLRAYTADTLVIDGTASSDKLLATLKDIGDMGVDEVRLAQEAGKPVYVDLGLDGLDATDGADEIRALLRSLAEGHDGPDPIFQGNEKVALVMDADAAHALAQVEGGVAQLKALGITEIDVLADADNGTAPAFGDVGIEVKLIGQDDELYRHLQHDR